jgi:hypothetical protein
VAVGILAITSFRFSPGLVGWLRIPEGFRDACSEDLRKKRAAESAQFASLL